MCFYGLLLLEVFIMLKFTWLHWNFEVPEAKKPLEEKVPVTLVPEKKEVPAPKGRDVWFLLLIVSLYVPFGWFSVLFHLEL